MHDVVSRIEGGQALAGIVIPPDYAKLLHRKESPEVMVAVDASDATAAPYEPLGRASDRQQA